MINYIIEMDDDLPVSFLYTDDKIKDLISCATDYHNWSILNFKNTKIIGSDTT